MSSSSTPPVESVRVDSDRRPAWVPWLAALAVLALLALLLLFLFDGDDEGDGDVAVPAVTQDAEVEQEIEGGDQAAADADAEPAPADSTAVVVDVGEVPAGTARVGDVDVFADQLSGADVVGQAVTANQVQVQELVADEAFYVGPEVGSTILVRLQEFAGEGAPESPFTVEPGDAVDISGELREIDEAFLSELQLYDGADQLELGDYYVQVEQISSVD